MTGFCADGNELSDFIKFGEFLYYLRKCSLLKNDCLSYSLLVGCWVGCFVVWLGVLLFGKLVSYSFIRFVSYLVSQSVIYLVIWPVTSYVQRKV